MQSAVLVAHCVTRAQKNNIRRPLVKNDTLCHFQLPDLPFSSKPTEISPQESHKGSCGCY